MNESSASERINGARVVKEPKNASTANQADCDTGFLRVSESALTIKDILGALRQDSWAEERIFDRFRKLGGVSSRWNDRDCQAMADAIAFTEDELEYMPGMAGGSIAVETNPKLIRRKRLRDLHRQLEAELWP